MNQKMIQTKNVKKYELIFCVGNPLLSLFRDQNQIQNVLVWPQGYTLFRSKISSVISIQKTNQTPVSSKICKTSIMSNCLSTDQRLILPIKNEHLGTFKRFWQSLFLKKRILAKITGFQIFLFFLARIFNKTVKLR